MGERSERRGGAVGAGGMPNDEARYREVINAISEAVIIHDPCTGRILDVNEPMLRMYGLASREEALSLEFSECSADGKANSWEQARRLIDAARGGIPQQFEWMARRKDGTIFPVEVSLRISRIGGEDRLLAVVRDITERKRVEDELRRRNELLRGVLDHSEFFIYVKDLEGRFLLASKSLALFLGQASHEQLIGKTSHEFLPKAVADRHRANDLDVAESGKAVHVVETVDTPEGTLSFLTMKFPLFDAERRLYAVCGLSVDISEQIRLKERAEAGEENVQTLFNAIDESICLIDCEGMILAVNPAFAKRLGLRPEDCVGRNIYSLVSPELAAARRVWLDEAITMRHAVEFEDERNGRLMYHHLFPVLGSDGTVTRLVVYAMDVTDRRNAERERERLQNQLAQAQKMESVGRLAGGVAHDFNNMLQTILGNVELILDELHPGEANYAEVIEIQKAAERSANLTQQLLAFARNQTVAPRTINLNETVDGMVRMLRRLIGEDIVLNWHPAQELWSVHIDPGQVGQILTNLCVNARDAVGVDGEITIQTVNASFDAEYCREYAGFLPGDYVTLLVSDNGKGMDKATQIRIFEPFFTTKVVGKGTGLGLATVYGIIKQNNGFIHVYSELGHGTTFKIYLPRVEGNADSDAQAGEPVISACGRETILLVEDESSILSATATMLRRLDYQVIAVDRPSEALRIASDFDGPIHLLLTDVVMHEMNGKELARQLLESRPEMRCLYMSGYTANVIAHHGVLDPGVRFIQKPFSRQDLAAKVREALGG